MKFGNYIKVMTIFIVLLCGPAFAANYTVSNRALNTITCPDGINITDIFMSEKSPIKAELRKDKVFFEFMEDRVDMDGELTVHRVTDSTTISVFCGDDEYSLTLAPRNVQGTRINLPTRKLPTLELDGLKREEQLSRLVQMVLTDNTTGFKSAPGDQVAKVGPAEIYLRKIHSVGNYKIKEIYVYSDELVLISEGDIITLPFVEYPAAVTLPALAEMGWQRFVVVEEVIK